MMNHASFRKRTAWAVVAVVCSALIATGVYFGLKHGRSESQRPTTSSISSTERPASYSGLRYKSGPSTSESDWLTTFSSRKVTENGSYYGEVSAATGRPKTVYVEGYYREDGTYVRPHYRSPPSTSASEEITTFSGPGIAENGSYYGETSALTGRPKTIPVKGYYRKDGTYVRGHYRSKPR